MNHSFLILAFSIISNLLFAQEDITNRMDSLENRNHSFIYSGNGKFSSLRVFGRSPIITVRFDSVSIDRTNNSLSIKGQTQDEGNPFPNLQILLGNFTEFEDTNGNKSAKMKIRLKFQIYSTGNFNYTFKFSNDECICFVAQEPTYSEKSKDWIIPAFPIVIYPLKKF